MTDIFKPQHDLDAQKQGRAWITDKGREALAFQRGHDAARDAIRPYLDNAINSIMRGEDLLRGR